MARLPRKIALLALLALSPACIITGGNTTITSDSDTGEFVCDDPNSYLDGETCYCNDGFEYCTDDPNDLSCCPVQDTTTVSSVGTTTLEPTTTEPSTTTTGPTTSDATTIPATTSTTAETTESTSTTAETSEGTSTTTGGEECTGPQPPPDERCQNGQFWCTMTEACGPEGSEVYRCDNGNWILEPNLAKDSCTFDGYDFAYGCIDNGKSVEFFCGEGPGTACENTDPATCADDTNLNTCIYGKLSAFDCFVQCTEVGDAMMNLYDHGFCGDDMGTSVCLCCDMGEPGCPV
ncbi:hypothetical protein [Nannocystis punicea]|uniref:Uncharacterized protein n=1 Tax=Nannocystis punicea TaxID=2995304 RepID=A0ABY7HG79_9BACT|nr:hypothetical protein [Nannocystis poenicansa]WAS98080.1 hypothetical protein O0S08_18230 [Nannocystis poenicansa]